MFGSQFLFYAFAFTSIHVASTWINKNHNKSRFNASLLFHLCSHSVWKSLKKSRVTTQQLTLEWIELILFWRENSYFSNTVSSWMPVVLKIIEFTDPDPRKNPNLTVIWPDRIGKIEGERLFVFYLRFLWDLTKSFLRGTRWKRARPSIIHWSLALVP